MRASLPGVLICLLLALAPARAEERPTVVELFTSQGCSSCPPADALLGELAKRPGLLALSLHIDYWDGLGWKDPFSSPAATARQRRYAAQLGLGGVYTPQIVVDGAWQAVGSDRAAVEDALTAAARHRRDVALTLAVDAGRARVEVAAAPLEGEATLVLIGFDRRHETAIGRGENAGRSLDETDVVRGLEAIGRVDGGAMRIAAPIRWRCDRLALLLEAADGHILGAAVADLGR